jgi:hypothetical protein
MIEENIKNYLEKLNLTQYINYFDETIYLFLIFGFLVISLAFLFYFLFRNKKKIVAQKENIKPNLEEIINKKEIKINDDNEFVDVLVAIEEEMLAVRELYVGGYISKGVYISETDRLYEKARVFGL